MPHSQLYRCRRRATACSAATILKCALLAGEELKVRIVGHRSTYFFRMRIIRSAAEKGRGSSTALEAALRTIPLDQCRSTYGGNVDDSMMCAYGYGADACQGDSGGPLVDPF